MLKKKLSKLFTKTDRSNFDHFMLYLIFLSITWRWQDKTFLSKKNSYWIEKVQSYFTLFIQENLLQLWYSVTLYTSKKDYENKLYKRTLYDLFSEYCVCLVRKVFQITIKSTGRHAISIFETMGLSKRFGSTRSAKMGWRSFQHLHSTAREHHQTFISKHQSPSDFSS